MGCCASLCLLCCAAARSCRHHDCQVTVAIGHGRVGSRFLRAGRPRQVTPALLVVGGGYTVQQPPRETAPRPLFHGVGLRGSETGTAATLSLYGSAQASDCVIQQLRRHKRADTTTQRTQTSRYNDSGKKQSNESNKVKERNKGTRAEREANTRAENQRT